MSIERCQIVAICFSAISLVNVFMVLCTVMAGSISFSGYVLPLAIILCAITLGVFDYVAINTSGYVMIRVF